MRILNMWYCIKFKNVIRRMYIDDNNYEEMQNDYLKGQDSGQ